jgi:cytidylate kinase
VAARNSKTIAIDGPAAAGKTTVGRKVAQRLGCRYLDTGLMYRAVTLLALQQSVAIGDEPALAHLARVTEFTLPPGPEEFLVVNGQPMLKELRTSDVDAAVSEVSAHPGVRQVLVQRQRELARDGCIVMVGRDIGTVVLPDADAKFWVTASARTRAVRRNLERSSSHEDDDIMVEMEQIIARDAHDSERPVSPLRQAGDAIVLETDDLSPDEVADVALQVIEDTSRFRSQESLA